jgi:hypothetical protein
MVFLLLHVVVSWLNFCQKNMMYIFILGIPGFMAKVSAGECTYISKDYRKIKIEMFISAY